MVILKFESLIIIYKYLDIILLHITFFYLKIKCYIILSKMHTTLSPGNDFYQYVNNAWLNDPVNQIPADYSSWGGFTKLYDARTLR